MHAVVPREPILRRALAAQLLTAAWMVVEGTLAVALGIAAGSVALTTFGIDSGIEIFSAIVVYRQLAGDSCTGHGEYTAGERSASRRVGQALWALVGYVLLTSGAALVLHEEPRPTAAGIGLALAVLAVMPALWLWRRRLARQLDNPALRGDVACSALCIYMAVTLLAGLGLNALLGWWWADPLAGLAMVWWISDEAREALEAARSGRHCEC